MRKLKFGLAFAAVLLLAGCLVSDAPMFDAETGSAAPLAPGRYNACSTPEGDGDPECDVIGVTRRDDGAYEFLVEENDRIMVRFHDMNDGGYAAQFQDDDGDGYQYYWAAKEGDTLSLVMIWCEDLPAKLRNKMRRQGLISFKDGDSTCRATSPKAVIRAAAAYRDGYAKTESAMTLTPAP